MTNHRRFAFTAQLVAEVAAQGGDFDTAMSMVDYAVGPTCSTSSGWTAALCSI